MKKFSLLIVCLVFLVTLSAAMSQEPQAPAGALDIEKVEPPSPEKLKAALKSVRELLAAEYKAAKNNQARWTLAGTLSQKATESNGDHESEYAFGIEAADLFASVGDALAAFRVIDELALTFAIPVVSTKVALFKKAVKEAKTPAQKRTAALIGLKLAGDAAKDEAYDAAKDLATLSLSLARPSRDSSAIQRATDQVARYTDAHKFWLSVQEARQQLKTTADDAEANETVGRYLCFVRQDWQHGLPPLKLALDQELKAVAGHDLSTTTDDAAVTAADAWWEVAERRKKERQQILPRCAYWYEKAIPHLTGLTKANAEKRLQAAYDAISGRNFPKILSEAANGVQSSGLVDCATNMMPATMQKSFDIRRSWILSLQFNTPNLDDGPHVIFGWADGRAGRDPIVVTFNGSVLACCVDDCAGLRRQAFTQPMTPQIIGKWVDVKFVHDAVSQELELYIDNRLIQREPLVITPNIDQEMPVCLGGIDGSGQRYVGLVRNVWLGNIK